jgi:hypothetical protein
MRALIPFSWQYFSRSTFVWMSSIMSTTQSTSTSSCAPSSLRHTSTFASTSTQRARVVSGRDALHLDVGFNQHGWGGGGHRVLEVGTARI